MKCPLFTTSSIDKGGIVDYKRRECLKEECAWWYDDGARCALLDICLTMNTIDLQLQEICEKMPHEG